MASGGGSDDVDIFLRELDSLNNLDLGSHAPRVIQNVQAPQPAPLSDFAQRYSHPTGPVSAVLAYTGKSGLTPIPSPSLDPPFRTEKEQKYINKLELYQRSRFNGFTIKQIHDLDAFAPLFKTRKDLDFLSLEANFPIHPLFERDRWSTVRSKTHPRVRLPGGGLGYWEASNELVWSVLSPCVRLASQILFNSHSMLWYDALFEGDTYSIPDSGLPDEWKGQKFYMISGFHRLVNEPKEFHKFLAEASYDINFDLRSGWADEMTSRSSGKFITGWATTNSWTPNKAIIYLSYENLLPLLKDVYTDAERRVDICKVAMILLHECCHTLWTYLMNRCNFKASITEAYFKGDGIAELGYSMETHVFGNTALFLTELTSDDSFGAGKGDSAAGILARNWFHKGNINYKGYQTPLPTIPPLPTKWDHEYSYPIPVSWVEDLYDVEFWIKYVRAFGAAALEMGPKTHGLKNSPGGNFVSRYNDADPHLHVEVPLSASMPEDEVAATEFENIRRIRANRVQNFWDASVQKRAEAARRAAAGLQPFTDVISGLPLPSSPSSPPIIETRPPPTCPRYDAITDFLLANRSQNELCIDSIRFLIPEHTLLEYILAYGGIYLTPEEWNSYLRLCDVRGEHFRYYQNCGLRGECEWIEKLDTSMNEGGKKGKYEGSLRAQQYPRPFVQERLEEFEDVCRWEKRDWRAWFEDWEMGALVEIFERRTRQYVAAQKKKGVDIKMKPFTEAEITGFVDEYERRWDGTSIWVWGSNGVVRRFAEHWYNF